MNLIGQFFLLVHWEEISFTSFDVSANLLEFLQAQQKQT